MSPPVPQGHPSGRNNSLTRSRSLSASRPRRHTSPRVHRLSPSVETQLRKSPFGACATPFSNPWHELFSSFTPHIDGDRKYRGSYRRGDPQKTTRSHDVVPKTKYVVSAQGAPRTTPDLMPGTHETSSQTAGSAITAGAVMKPAASKTETPAVTANLTAPLCQRFSSGPSGFPLSGRLVNSAPVGAHTLYRRG